MGLTERRTCFQPRFASTQVRVPGWRPGHLWTYSGNALVGLFGPGCTLGLKDSQPFPAVVEPRGRGRARKPEEGEGQTGATSVVVAQPGSLIIEDNPQASVTDPNRKQAPRPSSDSQQPEPELPPRPADLLIIVCARLRVRCSRKRVRPAGSEGASLHTTALPQNFPVCQKA